MPPPARRSHSTTSCCCSGRSRRVHPRCRRLAHMPTVSRVSGASSGLVIRAMGERCGAAAGAARTPGEQGGTHAGDAGGRARLPGLPCSPGLPGGRAPSPPVACMAMAQGAACREQFWPSARADDCGSAKQGGASAVGALTLLRVASDCGRSGAWPPQVPAAHRRGPPARRQGAAVPPVPPIPLASPASSHQMHILHILRDREKQQVQRAGMQGLGGYRAAAGERRG